MARALANDPRRGAGVGPQRLAEVTQEACRKAGFDPRVAVDAGAHMFPATTFWQCERPGDLRNSNGLATMGFALPAAIGAKLARPEAEVWVIAGDGGFQMTAAELSTLAQEGLNLKIAIINNGYLGMVRHCQELFYQGRYAATPIRSPDFVKLAEAHGLIGLRVSTRAEVAGAVERARREPGAVVVEFRVGAEDSVYPMVPAGGDLHNMIRRPVQNVLVESARD